MPDARRLYFLDNLKIGLTILVIAHHVGQAHGPTGGAWLIQEATRAAILGPFFTVNRSFFMRRKWYPIDRWVGFLGFIQVAFADVPRDLSCFVLGAVAYRRQWFLGITARMGAIWLSVGLTLAALWYTFSLGHLWSALHISREVHGYIYPVWESFLCCGMCLGLLVLFREKLNSQGRLGRLMAANQYAAYLFHVPVVIAIQVAVASAPMSPFTKFVLVTALSVPLTFLLSAAIRTPAFVRRVL